jgi:hypothetical protein
VNKEKNKYNLSGKIIAIFFIIIIIIALNLWILKIINWIVFFLIALIIFIYIKYIMQKP